MEEKELSLLINVVVILPKWTTVAWIYVTWSVMVQKLDIVNFETFTWLLIYLQFWTVKRFFYMQSNKLFVDFSL